jgi:transcription termination factor Rho
MDDKENCVNLAELKEKSIADLTDIAKGYHIEGAVNLRKQDLIFAILQAQSEKNGVIYGEGVLETLQDGFGFLRSPLYNYLPGPDDIYVSPSQIRRFNLRTGDTIWGQIRPPKEGERYFAMLKVEKVNFEDSEVGREKILFDNLTPLYPMERIRLENNPEDLSMRVIDLLTPIGKGQRGLIVAPPRTGKTVLLQGIAKAIAKNHPEISLIVLLIDERPEEVTDMIRQVKGEVVSSTFDEPPQRHIQVAEMVLEKAKRSPSPRRMWSFSSTASPDWPGPSISSHPLRKGPLGRSRLECPPAPETLLRIRPEYRGRRQPHHYRHGPDRYGKPHGRRHLRRVQGNRQHGAPSRPEPGGPAHLPAINATTSGTRKEELLLDKDDINKIWILRKAMNSNNAQEDMEYLLSNMKGSRSNKDFLEKMMKG